MARDSYPRSAPYRGPGSQRGAGAFPYPGREAFRGQDGDGEPVNGGSYAYVIRDERPSASRPREQESERPRQSASRPARPDLAGVAKTSAFASLAGAMAETSAPQPADPATVYGPDDPAYGPPSPDWYARDDEARRQEAEAEFQDARGPFEPLPPDHVVPEAPVFDSDDGETDNSGPLGYQTGDVSGAIEPAPEVDITLAGQGDGPPLERIKHLYATAEAVGDSRLDEHFEQLLERQRQLIREYFTESEPRTPSGFGRPRSPQPYASGDNPDRPGEADLSLRGARRGQP